MSLSSSTLLIFLFLIPGIAFRQLIYSTSIVKRPLSAGNAIQFVLSILTLSVACQLAGTAVFAVSVWCVNVFRKIDVTVGITDVSGKVLVELNGTNYTPLDFLYNHWAVALGYLGALMAATLLLAFCFAIGARSNPILGTILFGPLSKIMTNPVAPLIQCFVMTKITNGRFTIVYAGHPIEVALKDGSNIDHLVLRDAEKFYFVMSDTAPETTFLDARPVSSSSSQGDLLYISGEDIANAHFDHFYLLGQGRQ